MAEDRRIREAARALDADSFEVSLSSTPFEALTSAQVGFEVAVIELRLNGFSVARELRENPKTAGARIVMLPDRAHDEWLCRQAGADFVIVKPLPDTSTLERAITSILAKS